MAREDRSAHWRRMLASWSRSGLTGAAFCRRESLNRFTFYGWRRRLGVARRPRLTLVPVAVKERAASRSVVEVVLRGGRLARIHTDGDAAGIAQILGALESLSC